MTPLHMYILHFMAMDTMLTVDHIIVVHSNHLPLDWVKLDLTRLESSILKDIDFRI